jgi:hypothetical protein
MINGTVQCEELLASADSASYAAKNHGKNRVQVYDRNDERIVEFRRQGPRLEKIKEAISGQLPHSFLGHRGTIPLSSRNRPTGDC